MGIAASILGGETDFAVSSETTDNKRKGKQEEIIDKYIYPYLLEFYGESAE